MKTPRLVWRGVDRDGRDVSQSRRGPKKEFGSAPVKTAPKKEFGSPRGLPDSPFPLRRFKDLAQCPTARRRAAVTSHEVGCSTECCERRSRKRIGLLAPSMTSLFPESLSGVTPPPAPVLLRVRVHPPMSFTSPTEYEPLQTCPACRHAKRLPWGFLPHRGISPQSPLPSRLPSSCSHVPPSAFLAPSTVCSSAYLAGLFHPAATSGIHLPGVISRCLAEPSRRWPVPSCRSSTRSCRRVAPTTPYRADPPTGS